MTSETQTTFKTDYQNYKICIKRYVTRINTTSGVADVWQKQITDYPLAKVKESRTFRDNLVGFFESLINVLHETEALYTDEPLMENIARWVYTMSSSTLRPFRHTATTVALAMELALASVAEKLDQRITKTQANLEKERAQRGQKRNKEMIANLLSSLKEAKANRDMCGRYILDCFEVVFVHRYRDIDARIRTECVEALGSWIYVLPTVFMEPEYLRYLGWLLSDVVASTRQEVLRQLARVFKRDAAKLGHFIDRFRPRLMEIATQDLDVSVRVAAISVIEHLGQAGMLEPDEIDATGKLIFDYEPRIRKAVVKFFDEAVEAAVEAKVESMGGAEAVKDIFPEPEDADDPMTPRTEWMEIKALAETLAIYESQLEDDDAETRRGIDMSADMLSAVAPETRMSLASQALYEKLDIVMNWEILIGYLLHDHTTSTSAKSKSKPTAMDIAMRQHVAPTAEEEAILLEVLVASVKQNLTQVAEAEKRDKRSHIRGHLVQEDDIDITLIKRLSDLLNKFGAEPKTAISVLRLQRMMDVSLIYQMHLHRQFDTVLTGICTQFTRHVDKDMIFEVALGLLHCRKSEECEETLDLKLSGLWDYVVGSLRNLDSSHDLSKRGELSIPLLRGLTTTLMKISNLVKIKDCVDVLELENTVAGSTDSLIKILVKTVHRGRFQQPDDELDDLEDEATSFAIKSCNFYFMWKVRSLMNAIDSATDVSSSDINKLAELRKLYQTNLIHTFSSRAINDDLRLFATGSLCDLHNTFSSIKRTMSHWAASGANKQYAGLLALDQEIQPGLIPELINVFDGAERTFAKKTKKSLNEPAEDEDPIDEDQLSDDEEEEDLSIGERRAAELRAEKSLCELTAKYVLAILSEVVDQTGPHKGKLKKRLLRNATKLGKNYQETVAFFDVKKMREAEEAKKRRAASRAKSRSKPKAPAARPALSEEIVVNADDESEAEAEIEAEDEIEDPPEEGTEEDLRRRELMEEDPIEDPDSEPEADGGDGGAAAAEEESILGD